ncbi:MAG: YceI family protein [Planctomycetes bacterium]|nr:YceI family protein [Planctomycetota bacterium]
MFRPLMTCLVSTFAALALVGATQQKTPSATPASAPPASSAAAGSTTWKIDDTHSMSLFRVQHFGAGMFWGRFDGVTGTITTTGATPETLALNVTIDANSVSTANKDLDAHLRSPDFFSVKEFPQMTFVSTSAKKIDGNFWEVSGNITIRGTTKPLTAKVEFIGLSESPKGNRIGFEAVFTIDRGEFGVNYGLEKNVLGRNVRVTVGLEATSS